MPPKADIRQRIEHVCFVPIADINRHLFGAVVIALVRLVQLGAPVEIRPSTPWHWLAFGFARLRKLRRHRWNRVKRKYDGH